MQLQKASAVLLFFCFSIFRAPQIVAQVDSLSSDDTLKTFDKVEIEASYPGGDDAWIKFLQRTLNGDIATKNGAPVGYHTVIIQFIVDKEGKITAMKALTNLGYGMEAEVIRVLSKAPRWKPAMQDGRMVRAYRKQPVTFAVIEEKKKKKNKDD